MRSGPIVITIDHRISEKDHDAFLAVMRERRRIRRRDGASEWSLARDLADSEVWVERYRLSTWLDYLRLNSRRTNADELNLIALRRLWFENREPVVRRLIERQVSGPANYNTCNTRLDSDEAAANGQ